MKFDAKLFWPKVSVRRPCWIWIGRKDKDGYGCCSPGFGRPGFLRAHRVSWMIHFGEIPAGLLVLHTCDNPPCVNPAHLRLGTNHDNMRDSWNKGRRPLPSVTHPHRQARGERQHLAKLKAENIGEIFRLSYSGMNHRQIAERFSVSRHCIQSVLTRETWKHIEPPPKERV